MNHLLVILAALLPLLLVSCSAATLRDAAGLSFGEAASTATVQAETALRAQLEGLVGPGVYITRIKRQGPLALAAVIETDESEDAQRSQFYTVRTFRRSEAGGWEEAAPDLAAWGEQRTLAVDGLTLVYRAFDEPYVRAIAPRIAPALSLMAAAFGLDLPQDEHFVVRVTPLADPSELPFSENSLVLTVPSPLSPGFPLSIAQSPEEFLLGYTTDMLGHALLNRAFGDGAQEEGRLALAHAAVQWSVHRTVGRDFPPGYVLQIGDTPTPLVSLLNPTQFSAEGSRTAERDLFLRFAIATYGSEVVPAYLRTIFASNSAEELSRSAFDQDIVEIEEQWHKWLDHRLRVERPQQ